MREFRWVGGGGEGGWTNRTHSAIDKAVAAAVSTTKQMIQSLLSTFRHLHTYRSNLLRGRLPRRVGMGFQKEHVLWGIKKKTAVPPVESTHPLPLESAKV